MGTIDPAYYTVADGDGHTKAARDAAVNVGGDPRPVATKNPTARDTVYRNRRRVRGDEDDKNSASEHAVARLLACDHDRLRKARLRFAACARPL